MFRELKQLILFAPDGGVDRPFVSTKKSVDQLKKEAIDQVTTEVRKNPGEVLLSAEDLVNKAKVMVNLREDARDDLKKDVLAKLDGAAWEFNVLVASLSYRLKLKEKLGKINPSEANFDFSKAQKFLQEEKDSAVDWHLDYGKNDSVLLSLDAKIKEVNDVAVNRYSELVKEPSSEGGFNKEQLNKLMLQVGLMQKIDYGEFPGVFNKEDSINLKNNFTSVERQIMQVLLNNKGQLSVSDQAALKRLDYARGNLVDAEKDDNPEHLSGARAYMEMVLAEQDACRIRDEILDGVKKNHVYKDGQKFFDQAVILAANKKWDDSVKARDLFQKAAEKWKGVLELQKSKENDEVADKAVRLLLEAQTIMEKRGQDLNIKGVLMGVLFKAKLAIEEKSWDKAMNASRQVFDMVAAAERALAGYKHVEDRFGKRADFGSNPLIQQGKEFYKKGEFGLAEIYYGRAIEAYVKGSEGPLLASK
jgi:hypothetical protein